MPDDPQSTNHKPANLQLGDKFYTHLTFGARDYFNKTVDEYAEKLLRESLNIEQLEHVGEGPPEITAVHIEEAKLVLVRRLRKKEMSLRWTSILRLLQVFASIAIGIGASNFYEVWGALMCVIGVAIEFILFIIEREMFREL